ncbi:helix-turn-helix domain-containing protein [Pseudomonas huanghezhanensis]|uniref:helix-turn-helix domain-containing protein n=1 Tax=Pseudomonas huanghezhanensis TaxID=3002903 RepID=UPI0022864B07|nr:helix-turn-helix transcriptional regulator [Pseudomonas sp. BSw22131]
MNDIGKRLKQERKRLNLTQGQMGAIGGVEVNAQGHYESGQRIPRADYLFRIAAVGVDINHVVTGEGISRISPASASNSILYRGGEPYAMQVQPTPIESLAEVIDHLRHSLWVTSNALCEASKIVSQHIPDQIDVAPDQPGMMVCADMITSPTLTSAP